MKTGKMVLPNHKKNDTLLKAQLKTCSIWKKGGSILGIHDRNRQGSGVKIPRSCLYCNYVTVRDNKCRIVILGTKDKKVTAKAGRRPEDEP